MDITDAEPVRIFAQLEQRVRQLHPALAPVKFTHRWGGPILFRDSWKPVFDWHPASVVTRKDDVTDEIWRNAVVLGAYAGHGVALSSYLGTWAAEVLLQQRQLPKWSALQT